MLEALPVVALAPHFPLLPGWASLSPPAYKEAGWGSKVSRISGQNDPWKSTNCKVQASGLSKACVPGFFGGH